MPRFEPFTGLRYDASRVDPSMVVAPPYDVIDPEERALLAARHSANAVRVELPEPDHRAGLDRYANAARLMEEWQKQGILLRDPSPALYAYRMTSPDGHSTNGVIGAVGIDDQSAESIFPHEQTLPKAKTDRLELLRSTRANLSPIWGLSLSAGLTGHFVQSAPPDMEAVDDDGVRHELWVLDDSETIDAVREPVRPESSSAGNGQAGADLLMALVVELSEEQLDVGPIHRVLSGLPDGLDLVDAFASWFEVTRAGDFDERTTGALGASGALALVMPSGAWMLSPKDGTAEAAGSGLDSSMVALVIAELPDHELEFSNSWREAIREVGTERAQAAILLRPVSVEQIAEWARTGRRMPPKTTYFRPKPRTGMVFRTLDEPG